VVFTIAALALLALVGLVLGVYLVPMAHDEVSFLSVKAFGPSGKTTFNVNATIPNGITDPEWNDVFAARRLPAGLWVALGDWCLSQVKMLAIRSQMSQNYT
jgi:hypothetical protein